jgi:hypothetical protein
MIIRRPCQFLLDALGEVFIVLDQPGAWKGFTRARYHWIAEPDQAGGRAGSYAAAGRTPPLRSSYHGG